MGRPGGRKRGCGISSIELFFESFLGGSECVLVTQRESRDEKGLVVPPSLRQIGCDSWERQVCVPFSFVNAVIQTAQWRMPWMLGCHPLVGTTTARAARALDA